MSTQDSAPACEGHRTAAIPTVVSIAPLEVEMSLEKQVPCAGGSVRINVN